MEPGSKFPESSVPVDHEYYESLCALATSGGLTETEWQTVRLHMAECPSCATLLVKYRTLAKHGLASLASKSDAANIPAQDEWSVESAKQELFARIARGEAATRVYSPSTRVRGPDRRSAWRFLISPAAQRYGLSAAVIALMVILPLFAYKQGRKRGVESARMQAAQVSPAKVELATLAQQHSDLGREIGEREAQISNLQQQLAEEKDQVAQLKTLQAQYQQDSSRTSGEIAGLKNEATALAAQRDEITRKLQEAESSLEPLQRQIESLQQQRSRDLVHTAALERRIEDLSTQLKESEDTVQQQAQFLASDRDVRELMGARDLYIADVFDVDREGQTQKVFGRVFYTSGKSLIFYAFDLDKQPGLRDASTFQAWGRRGPNDKRPLNMGIFYLDNQAKKRWVLRFDDPKLLNQIDAVFVTVEPNGGRPKPSGKQLLFASLRTPPNHP